LIMVCVGAGAGCSACAAGVPGDDRRLSHRLGWWLAGAWLAGSPRHGGVRGAWGCRRWRDRRRTTAVSD